MNKATDESNDKSYFTLTPRIVWAKCTDPYEFTLWSVIKGIAGESGECYLSTPDLAKLSMMSAGKVSSCRKSLIKKGLLKGAMRKDPGYPQPVWHLSVPDLWQENIAAAQAMPSLRDRIDFKAKQKEPSPGERGLSPDERGTTPGETKNISSRSKKNPPTPSGAIPKITEPKDDFSDMFDSDGSVCPPQEPPKPVKLDVLTHTAEQAGRRDADPLWWLKPGQPCGDHDYLKPCLKYCGVLIRKPENVGEHQMKTWLRQFGKISVISSGEDGSAPVIIQPGVMADAIYAIRDDWSFKERKWITPFSTTFVDRVRDAAGQIMDGTLVLTDSKSWSGSL